MASNIEKILQSLASGEGDRWARCSLIDELVESGNYADLVELAHHLETSARGDPIQFISLLGHIESRLALIQRHEAAEAVLTLSQIDWRKLDPRVLDTLDRCQSLASKLGSVHPIDTLRSVIKEIGSNPAHTELLACWVQEHVLRNSGIDDDFDILNYWDQLSRQNHPLAKLPLSLLPSETTFTRNLTRYDPGQGTWDPGFPDEIDEDREAILPLYQMIGEMEPSPNITSAVHRWGADYEVRKFQLVSKQGTTSVPEFLTSLGLKCLKNADIQSVHCRITTFQEVLSLLFQAAAVGGIYGGKSLGAYGRLLAWKSIAGFLDSPIIDPIRLDNLASQYTWLEFLADSEWFYQHYWEYGFAAINPDDPAVTILAFTEKG